MSSEISRPAPALVIVTQSLLGALFLIGIGTIALLPGFSASVAESLPEYGELRTPLLTLAIAITVFALVSLAMIGLLVDRIHRGTMLARASLLWVDALVTSLVCCAAVVIASFVVVSNGQAGSPFVALIQTMACVAFIAVACITVVLRSLLRHAILLRTELDEVV